jgi:hypothetical protein
VTDIFGNTLTDTNIPMEKGRDIAGSAQFPSCKEGNDTGAGGIDAGPETTSHKWTSLIYIGGQTTALSTEYWRVKVSPFRKEAGGYRLNRAARW